MAVVKLTDAVKDEILMSAAAPFRSRYVETATKVSESDQSLLYKTLFISDEMAERLAHVPKEWLRMYHTESGLAKIFVAHQEENKSTKHWLQLTVPKDNFYAYEWCYNPTAFSDSVQQAFFVPETVNSSWKKADLKKIELSTDYITQLEQICVERDTQLGTLKKIIDGCDTLNQVEKIWPAIRKYVKPETLARLDRKVVRKTKEAIGLDNDELQSLNVHHIRQQMIG